MKKSNAIRKEIRKRKFAINTCILILIALIFLVFFGFIFELIGRSSFGGCVLVFFIVSHVIKIEQKKISEHEEELIKTIMQENKELEKISGPLAIKIEEH